MLFKKQGTQWVDLDVTAKRGLSWVNVKHEYVWGKLNGVWRRGTRKIARVTLDPAVRTVYWDLDLWEQLGRPTEDLDVRITVGKNAILAQSFVPSPESQAAYEAFRQAEITAGRTPPPAYIPSPAAANLAGGWGLNTTFEVLVAGGIFGCSGYGAEPVEIAKKAQPTTTAQGAAPSLVVAKTTESLQDAVHALLQNGGAYHPRLSFFMWSDGIIDGFFEKGKTGGRGGAAVRTNRPTKITFVKNQDNTYGVVAGGGGGGGGIGAFWRRYYGGAYLIMQSHWPTSQAITWGQVPSYSGMWTLWAPAIVADDTFTKQWSLAGWGGALGAGATQAFGVGPNSPVTLEANSLSSAALVHANWRKVTKAGRLTPPWPRAKAARFGTDGINGRWYYTGGDLGQVSDVVFNSVVNRPAANVPGRSAGSGHADGAGVHFGTSAQVRANRNVLANDLISAALTTPAAAVTDASVARFSTLQARSGSPQLKMYERGSPTLKFRGGSVSGALTAFTGDKVLTVVTGQVYAFPYHYLKQRNAGDYLMETTINSGEGGLLGKAGSPAVLNYGGSSLPWNSTRCGGYSHFPVLQDTAGNKLAGAGGAAGPAVIGSEYVTFAGSRNTVGDLKSITGPVVPFE